uniref:SAM domain-containing protein n=1 Tax=Elaeophora elaphi TaxID=1147741 RepID=A0A0R3RJD7_9BILA
LQIKSKSALVDLRDTVNALLRESLQGNKLNRITQKCRWCRKAYPSNITSRIRNSGMAEVTFWISQYALGYAQRDETFKLFAKTCDFELAETLANDMDPGLLEIQRYRLKPNFLMRTSRHVRNVLRHAMVCVI